ncbi:MAG: SDR family oxidoreductase [Myxococcales bacterium]
MEAQTIIVFGGSSGIGEATARLAAAKGARVVIVGRNPEKLEAVRLRTPGRVVAAAVDGSDRSAVDRFFAVQGPFDHLVLSLSGSKGAGPFASLDLAALREGFEEKLFPQLSVAQAALPTLREGGSLTFISASSARSAMPGTAGLAAINAGVEAVVPVLARELGPTRVNAVCPGVIDTPWWERLPREARDAFFADAIEKLPVRRVGKPEDVAAIVLSLVQNGFVTGSVFEVDGGGRLV